LKHIDGNEKYQKIAGFKPRRNFHSSFD